MKALVFTDKEQLEYQSVPSPTPKGEELLVKVSAAGICGSDMHAYHGFDDRRIPPLILGHEISGTICLLYTSPSPRDTERSRMPSSA